METQSAIGLAMRTSRDLDRAHLVADGQSDPRWAGTKHQMWSDALSSIVPLFLIVYVILRLIATVVPLPFYDPEKRRPRS